MTDALGVVPTEGRGSMPFALLHNESLVAVASWALGHAGVELLDFDAPWSAVVERDLPLVVHDPLCPGTPVEFLLAAVDNAVASGAVVVGTLEGAAGEAGDAGELGGTAASGGSGGSESAQVTSPVVLPAAVVAELTAWPDLTDLAGWVEELRRLFSVLFLEAPTAGRRVADASDVRQLEDLVPDA